MNNTRANGARSGAARNSSASANNRNLAPVRRTSGFADNLQNKIDGFLGSVGDLLNDITALEVNTMVVSEITGHKFNPEDAYIALYEIPINNVNDPYFETRRIPLAIRPRYLELRKKLKDAYDEYLNGIQDSDLIPELPDPHDNLEEGRLIRLLSDSQFLRNLRKLRELRNMLEGSQSANENIIDIISAQTVIQLDGDILNRFDRRLLSDRNKDFLLEVHKQAVISGEGQWRSLLKFMVELVDDIIRRRSGNHATSLLPDGKTPDQ